MLEHQKNIVDELTLCIININNVSKRLNGGLLGIKRYNQYLLTKNSELSYVQNNYLKYETQSN